jgi:hypothetical protein
MSWVNVDDNIIDFFSKKRTMSTVHEDDVDIVKLIDPVMETGPWIAGGSVLNWYLNEPLGESDIDVFFRGLKQFDVCFAKIMSTANAELVYSSDNAVTIHAGVKGGSRKRIQLIRKSWFDSAEKVIDRFDFTVCQLVTDGYTLLLGKDTAQHVQNKTLDLVSMPPHADIVKRLIKYVAYGYTPKPEVMQYILDNESSLNWKFNGMDSDYDAAF